MIRPEDIIKPLIFLDIFDYPPTALELWRFLGVQAELGEVAKILSSFVIPTEARLAHSGGIPFTSQEGIIGEKRDPSAPAAAAYARDDKEERGFYFLPGHDGLVARRREFFHLAEKKFKIAKRAAWLLHFIPSIKMVALCNNFYYRNESDIDFFIIASKGRLWLTRFCATVLLDFFHLRAHGKKTADRICLSFYLSEADLNLERIALKPEDPYLSYWLAFLEPIYGQEYYDKLWNANGWLKNIFPNILPKQPVPRRSVGPERSREHNGSASKKKSSFGDWLEMMVKKIQWQKIPRRVKEMSALGDTRVIINNEMLKFHENDRRAEFRDNYKLRIINYK